MFLGTFATTPVTKVGDGAAVASRLIELSGGPHRPGGQGLHHRESGVDSFADGFHRFKEITRQRGEKFQLFCPGHNPQLPSSGHRAK